MGHQIKLVTNGTYTLTTKDTWCEDDITLLVDVVGGVGDLKATLYGGTFTVSSTTSQTFTINLMTGGEPPPDYFCFFAIADDQTLSPIVPYQRNLLKITCGIDKKCHETYCDMSGSLGESDTEGAVISSFNGSMGVLTIDPQNVEYLRQGKWTWFLVYLKADE